MLSPTIIIEIIHQKNGDMGTQRNFLKQGGRLVPDLLQQHEPDVRRVKIAF